MPRARTEHHCSACHARTARWAGRCPGCGEWNTLVERAVSVASSRPTLGGGPGGAEAGWAPWESEMVRALPLASVDPRAAVPESTGLVELDRVLGGGLVRGSVTLVGGEPGVGKSTLLLQVLGAVAGTGRRALLVSAEESAEQVRARACRLGPLPEELYLLATTDLMAAAEVVAELQPHLLVVDSIQTVIDREGSGPPGSLGQVRVCAERCVRLAKATGVRVVLVGHVTKEGSLAGPRALEHLVDTVISVEGDRHHALRLVRAVKHRFGSTGELGLFEMAESGLAAVGDPYRLLLGDRRPGMAGSSVLPAVEGARALLVEVQALVAPAGAGIPARRSAQGLDGGRLAQLLAVLARDGRLLSGHVDVFASAIGGVRVAEPAADLAVALSVVSSASGRPVPADLVVFGEVGLSGELRQVPGAERRLAEAARVGFDRAVVPASSPEGPPGMELLRVRQLDEAMELVFAPDRGAGGPERSLTDRGGRSG